MIIWSWRPRVKENEVNPCVFVVSSYSNLTKQPNLVLLSQYFNTLDHKMYSYQQQSLLKLDRGLVFALLALLAFGLVMVASASIARAQVFIGFGLYFFVKEAVFVAIGVCACGFMVFVPTKQWQRLGQWWIVIGLILLLLVLVPGIGRSVNGSRRWIALGPIALQVSEAVKWCAVMYVGDYLVRHGDAIKSLTGLIKPLIVLAFMGVLLLLEPDFGATVVMFATALGMMFLAGARIRWFVLFIAIAVLAAGALIIVSPYRMYRLVGFMHPWKDQLGAGYQLTQALIAVGRGGVFGVGLGNSLQKLFYLPEAHTDFILAIIAEELGLIGVLCLLVLFGFLIYRGIKIAARAYQLQQHFESYIGYGVVLWVGMQVIVNACVNVGLLPTKGLTLPFISYGGSSLVIDCLAIGLLLRIDLQSKLLLADRPFYEEV